MNNPVRGEERTFQSYIARMIVVLHVTYNLLQSLVYSIRMYWDDLGDYHRIGSLNIKF